jgi:hypothetical protein
MTMGQHLQNHGLVHNVLSKSEPFNTKALYRFVVRTTTTTTDFRHNPHQHHISMWAFAYIVCITTTDVADVWLLGCSVVVSL